MNANEDVESLFTLLREGCFKDARGLCRKLVENGQTGLAVHLGWMYESGKGGDRDLSQARNYYQMAAFSGDLMSQHYLGRFLMRSNEPASGLKKQRVNLFLQACIALVLFLGGGPQYRRMNIEQEFFWKQLRSWVTFMPGRIDCTRRFNFAKDFGSPC